MGLRRFRTKAGARAFMVLVAVVTAALAASCSSSGSGGTSAGGTGGKGAVDVTLAQAIVGLGTAPITIAVSKGYFKQAGLNVKLVQVQGDSLVESALTSGKAQFGQSTPQNQVLAISEGRPLKLVSAIDYADYGYFISAKKAKDLGYDSSMTLAQRTKLFKGLKIGVGSVGGLSELVMQQLFKDADIDPKSQKIIAVGTNSSFAALKSGAVDAAFLGEPAMTQSLGSNLAVPAILANDVPWLSGVPTQGVATTASYAKSHPEVVKNFNAAVQRALTFMHTASAATVASAIKSDFPDMKSELLAQILKRSVSTTVPKTASYSKGEFAGLLKQNLILEGKKLDVSYTDAVFAG
jgi:NitT/TauT family transport system substrate-binding protein